MSTSRGKPRLRIEDVFLLDSPGATRFYWGEVKFEGALENTASRIMEVPALVASGRMKPAEHIEIRITKGGQAGDFIWNDGNLLVASEKVLQVLESKRFRGFFPIPTEVLMKTHSGPLRGYSVLAIRGRAGPIDEVRSRVVRSGRYGPDGRPRIMAIDGLYFDSENWDGSDIFSVEDFPLQALITRDVLGALRDRTITNFSARPLSEFRFGYGDP